MELKKYGDAGMKKLLGYGTMGVGAFMSVCSALMYPIFILTPVQAADAMYEYQLCLNGCWGTGWCPDYNYPANISPDYHMWVCILGVIICGLGYFLWRFRMYRSEKWTYASSPSHRSLKSICAVGMALITLFVSLCGVSQYNTLGILVIVNLTCCCLCLVYMVYNNENCLLYPKRTTIWKNVPEYLMMVLGLVLFIWGRFLGNSYLINCYRNSIFIPECLGCPFYGTYGTFADLGFMLIAIVVASELILRDFGAHSNACRDYENGSTQP